MSEKFRTRRHDATEQEDVMMQREALHEEQRQLEKAEARREAGPHGSAIPKDAHHPDKRAPFIETL